MQAKFKELNAIFEEIGEDISLEVTDDVVLFPPLSAFAIKEKFLFYKFDLLKFQRYILGLEYILVNSKYEKLIHQLYWVFMMGEDVKSVKQPYPTWNAEILKSNLSEIKSITGSKLLKIYPNLDNMCFDNIGLDDIGLDDIEHDFTEEEDNEKTEKKYKRVKESYYTYL